MVLLWGRVTDLAWLVQFKGGGKEVFGWFIWLSTVSIYNHITHMID